MTSKQRDKFYFPAWRTAAARHNWFMVRGRLQARAPGQWGADETTRLIHTVWNAGLALAQRDHCGMTADHLRHGCHVVALGSDHETNRLENKEVDRVVTLFRLLADHDDLDAALLYFEPSNAERQLVDLLGWPERKIRAVANEAGPREIVRGPAGFHLAATA